MQAPIQLHHGMKILFQGDSITDAWRTSKLNDGFQDVQYPLGIGYAYLITARLAAAHPALQLGFENRGIGGNRVRDLKRRWKKDCLDLRPDLLSILIGINDTWRVFDSHDPSPIDAFLADYRTILTEVKNTCNPILVLCEPFVLPYPEDRKAWRADLDPRIDVVRALAREFNAILVPLDSVFTQAAKLAPPEYWTEDGVHPTAAGFGLIANAWTKAVLGIGD